MRFARVTASAGLVALAVMGAMAARGLADGGGDQDQNRVRLEAVLTAADTESRATGDVRFEMRTDRAELRVDVQHITSTDVVDVFVNGSFLGTIVLNGDSGRLELNSQNGDAVPSLQAGDEVDVFDAADDATLLLSGILAAHN
jgi:hypothetical protein